MYKGVFGTFLEILFPAKCIFCRKLLVSGEKGICSVCKDSYKETEPEVSSKGAYSICFSSLNYSDQVRKAFHRFKFGGQTNYAQPFGEIMAKTIRENLNGRYDLITWVPISQNRKKNRGYDQAMLLAYAVAVELQDVAVETLIKIKDTPAQSNIGNAAQRKDNVSGAYRIADQTLVIGKRILLIDDILTTGSTLSECASVLQQAGATEVVGVVFASSNEKAKIAGNQ